MGETLRVKVGLNILVLMLSMWGISTTEFVFDRPTTFERLLINAFAPIQQGLSFVQRRFSHTIQDYFLLVDAKQENRELKQKVSTLQSQVFELGELGQENQRLKQLLQFDEGAFGKKVLAQIVGWDSSSDFKVLRINKGLSDGVQIQSVVVNSKGLIGYVYRATDHFSDVLTILDPHNKVDAIVARTRSHGIVEGFSHQYCLMKYVTRTEPVQEKDIIVTSGLGNIYPKGLRIGKIDAIEKESYGITQFIKIKPFVDFSRLEEVVVLNRSEIEKRQREFEILNQTETVGGVGEVQI